jgi:hypothetical protein
MHALATGGAAQPTPHPWIALAIPRTGNRPIERHSFPSFDFDHATAGKPRRQCRRSSCDGGTADGCIMTTTQQPGSSMCSAILDIDVYLIPHPTSS